MSAPHGRSEGALSPARRDRAQREGAPFTGLQRALRPAMALAALALALAGCTTPPATPPQGLNAAMGSASAPAARSLILVTMRNAEHEDITGGADIAKPPLPPRYAALMRDWEARFGVRRVADWALRSLPVRCMVFEVTGAKPRDVVLREMQGAPLVETVQPLQEFAVMAEHYNDPYLKLQHGFQALEVERSHRWATGRGVRVAVIDTGLDAEHPELRGRVSLRRNLVDGDLTTFDRDVHGTAVAAIIGAAANNAQGLVGVAPEVEFVALKACWQERPGDSEAKCNSFTLAKAMDVALAQRVDIINLSLGGPPDPLLNRLAEQAVARDVIVVGAVDRRHPNGFPAASDGVIAVDTEARTRNAGARPALHAPGEQVVSARPQGRYDMFSGSSVATAQVSGVAALVRQRKPHLPVRALNTLLKNTADPQTGLVNACYALARVAEQSDAACR